MLGTWLQDLESLEEISQNDDTRRIFLRMAAMQRTGRMDLFLTQLAEEPEIDDDTKVSIAELAHETDFLLAVEDYCARTDRLH
jgi:hypothetical protein